MKPLIFLLCLALSFAAQSQKHKGNTPAQIKPDTVALKKKYAALKTAAPRALGAYLPPIYITKGGTYTGNYRSDDPNTPAILILCYDSVIITGCNIMSAGEGIKAYGGSRLFIHHNNIIGNNAGGNRALNDYQPQTLTFENNYVEHTGGLMIDHANENTKSANFRYNLIRNTDRRKTDGTPGELKAAILFNTVTTIQAEIAWNRFENIVDSSYIEDNINLGNTGGTSASPISIHDNFIKGAYVAPRIYPPLGTVGYSGSGITVEDNGGVVAVNEVSRWINITNNQVVSVGNGGINVNAGHDVSVTGNRIISSGMYPDGTPSNIFWGGGAIWNGSNLPPTSFFNVSYKNNTVGYVRPDQNTIYKGTTLTKRNDWVIVAGSPINIIPDDNISLPNPITLSTELNEDAIWLVKSKGKAIGNTAAIDLGTTVNVGEAITGTIAPIDSTGATVTYRTGSLAVATDGLTLANVTSPTTFTVKGLKVGVSSITVSIITNSGKLLTKTVQVTVTDPTPVLPEAVDIVIIFSR